MRVADTPGSGAELTVACADLDEARATVAALRGHGVPVQAIAIARPPTAKRPEARARAPLMMRVLWRGFWWSAVGAVAGAVVGLVLARFDIGIPGTGVGPALQVASWAMFLHVAGALGGAYLVLTEGGGWELEPPRVAGVQVRVRGDDASLAVARAALAAMAGRAEGTAPQATAPNRP
jgi:hypothetical protein